MSWMIKQHLPEVFLCDVITDVANVESGDGLVLWRSDLGHSAVPLQKFTGHWVVITIEPVAYVLVREWVLRVCRFLMSKRQPAYERSTHSILTVIGTKRW